MSYKYDIKKKWNTWGWGWEGGGPVLKHLCNVHHLILQDFLFSVLVMLITLMKPNTHNISSHHIGDEI